MSNYEIFIDPISNIVFTKTDKGTVPIGINYNKDTGDFESIEGIDYFQTFIEYVIRSRQYYDVVRRKYKYRELFPYQWSVCLIIIDSVLSQKGRKILPIQARQTGKSEAIKVYLPFLVVFARQYIEFIHERFTGILGSYKADTIDKLRKEVLPYFKVAIEVYNEMYKDIELVSGLDGNNNKLINNSNRLEIGAKVDGQILPYSECENHRVEARPAESKPHGRSGQRTNGKEYGRVRRPVRRDLEQAHRLPCWWPPARRHYEGMRDHNK